jgi:hypothetical protein
MISDFDVCSWSRADQLRLGARGGCKYQAARDLVGCCYHRGLRGAIIGRLDPLSMPFLFPKLSLLYSEIHW